MTRTLTILFTFSLCLVWQDANGTFIREDAWQTEVDYASLSYTVNYWNVCPYNCCYQWCGDGCDQAVEQGQHVGVAYAWGHWETIPEFLSNLATPPPSHRGAGGGPCLLDRGCITGIDCSGLVSRAWGLFRHYGTIEMWKVSDVITVNELRLADILNRPDDHVVMFKEWVDRPLGIMTIGHATLNSQNKGDVRIEIKSLDNLSGYEPRRAKTVAPDIRISRPEVTGGDYCITLSWRENDGPGVYHVYRADQWLGPYREIASFESGDERYTQNGTHYSYPDDTVQYFRRYYYRVLDTPFGWGMAQGLPPATLPSTPTGLVASNVLSDCGSTASLVWEESVDADSYYVFRSPSLVLPEYPACPDFLGTTLLPEYIDSDVSTDSLYCYAVVAANGTGSSDCSAPDSVIAVRELTDVSVMKSRVLIGDDSLLVCPGGDGDSLALWISLVDTCGLPIADEPPSSVYGILVNTVEQLEVCVGDTLRPVDAADGMGRMRIVTQHIGGCDTATVRVYARGRLLSQQPVLHLRSPDLNGDGLVDGLDSGLMSQGGPCTDLNWDGVQRDGLDLSIISIHWQHTCSPTVALTAPNGSEWWQEGDATEVLWQFTPASLADDYSAVNILLSRDGGTTYSDTICTSVSNNGSHEWLIPAGAASGDCRVKVEARDFHGCLASGFSSQSFAIAKVVSGSVDANTVWSTPVSVVGDVTVAGGVTLALNPGVRVRFATSDALHAGADTARCELVVMGSIEADGNENGPIEFSSLSATPQSGDWRGIELESTSEGNVIDNCIIKHVHTGVEACSTAVTVDSCVISDFENDGIKAIASDVEITWDSLAVGSAGVRGIELTSTTSGTVSHNKITGPGNRVTYGIELKDSAEPDIEYNWIDGVKYGIKCGGSSGSSIEHNWIKNTTGNGIQTAEEAGAVVRYTTIESFQGTGVTAIDYSNPNLGASPDSGCNRIYAGSGYYVASLTEYTVMAELNWWGSSSPGFRKFYGRVDYSPLCTSDPGTSYALPLPLLPAAGPVVPYVMQNYPNPFNPRTTIEYGVSEPGTRVKVVVYDISGRVIRVLVDEARPAGHHAVVWDGRNNHGEVVVSGVYVCDVQVGSLRQQKKLVVLR